MKKIRLKYICDPAGQYGLNVSSDSYASDGVRLLRTSDISADGTADEGTDGVFVSEELARPLLLRDGDVLLSRSGTLGRALLYDFAKHGRATFAAYLVRFSPKPSVHPRYLWYATQSHDFQAQVVAGSIESTISNFNAEKYSSVAVPVWPNITQMAIADFLDDEIDRLDSLIAAKRRMLELVWYRYIAEVDNACRGVGQFVALKRVARVTYGLGQPPPLSEDGIALIRATNISRGTISEVDMIRSPVDSIPQDRAPLLRVGEILVVRSGAYTGDSALIPKKWEGSAPGYDLRVTPIRIVPRFLAHQLLGRLIQSQIDIVRSRAAQPHLNAEDLGQIKVVWADAAVETSIAVHLDESRSTADSMTATLNRQLGILEERRKAVITAAVSGQIPIPGAARD